MLIAGGFSAARVAPVYFRYYRFEDELRQSARFATEHSDSTIKVRLQLIVDSLDLPRAARNIHVKRGADSVIVYATYSELIDLIVWKRVLRLNPRGASSLR